MVCMSVCRSPERSDRYRTYGGESSKIPVGDEDIVMSLILNYFDAREPTVASENLRYYDVALTMHGECC